MATLTGSLASSGQPSAPLRVWEFDVAMDASYPTGGETIAAIAAALDGYTIVANPHYVVDVGGTIRKFQVNKTTFKVQAFTNLDVEVAAAVDLSGYTSVKLIVIGY